MAEVFRTKQDYHRVEANYLTGDNAPAVSLWCGGVLVTEHDALQHEVTFMAINVPTSDGMKRAQEGDWVVKLPNGTFAAVKPDKFEEVFEAVVDG